jgi:hypothetical protein
MDVVLLMGLAALGYALANETNPKRKKQEDMQGGGMNPMETFVNPQQSGGAMRVIDTPTGHANMVPFFGANMTQSMYSGATDGILDTYTGTGKQTFFHKEESPAFFAPEKGNGNPWGQPVETDFEQSRMVTSLATKNVFPIDRVYVGPGVNDGYTNLPSGGYQQDAAREYALPLTTDEIRVASKPKLTYKSEAVPGAFFITEVGIQAPVKKNRPDRFVILEGKDGEMEHLNTAVGQQVAGAMYPEQVMKTQKRESTSEEFIGGPQSANTYQTYIRSFTEPFQQFMKLTVEGRPTPGGPVGGMANLQTGPQSYNVATHRDESIFAAATRFDTPLLNLGGQAPTSELQGSVKYFNPLQEDIYVQRNNKGILEGFNKNPYTQSLSSTGTE